jgi:hypothetical protein
VLNPVSAKAESKQMLRSRKVQVRIVLASPPEAGQAEDGVSVSSSSKEHEDGGGNLRLETQLILFENFCCHKLQSIQP